MSDSENSPEFKKIVGLLVNNVDSIQSVGKKLVECMKEDHQVERAEKLIQQLKNIDNSLRKFIENTMTDTHPQSDERHTR